MNMRNIAKIAGANLFALALIFGSTPQVHAAEGQVTAQVSESVAQATVNPADQVSIDAVIASKSNYEAALATYEAALPGSKAAKQSYRAAMKAWKSLVKTQSKAKKQIGKTFKLSVAAAKRAFNTAVKGNHNVSAKAEAKAAKNAAVASASVSRNDALAAIKFNLSKPTKP